MKRITTVLLATILGLFLMANTASADYYSETLKQFQTIGAESFIFDFAAPPSDGSDGMITIEALGDYFGKRDGTENLDLYLDSILEKLNIGKQSNGSISPEVTIDASSYHPDGYLLDDVLWEGVWSIPGADLLGITGGLASVVLKPGVGVPSAVLDPSHYVQVTLEYNAVPIPGALLLLGSGLVGLAGLRRKIRS